MCSKFRYRLNTKTLIHVMHSWIQPPIFFFFFLILHEHRSHGHVGSCGLGSSVRFQLCAIWCSHVGFKLSRVKGTSVPLVGHFSEVYYTRNTNSLRKVNALLMYSCWTLPRTSRGAEFQMVVVSKESHVRYLEKLHCETFHKDRIFFLYSPLGLTCDTRANSPESPLIWPAVIGKGGGLNSPLQVEP